MAAKHQLEELGNRFGILPDLSFGPSIQNGKTSVDMPFVGVDTKHNIAFYVLNTANVAVDLPRKLIVGEPCGAHTQESGMSDSLRIRCNSVMLLGSQIDDVRIEARENVFDQSKALLRCAMLDQCKRLALGINLRSMQGVAGDDLDVFR